jgi:arginyl-tRNA synthetase
MQLTRWARQAFSGALEGGAVDPDKVVVQATADESFGDYQCNTAMALAKALKRNPRELAQSVLDAGPLPEAVDRAEVAGPGFINLYLSDRWLAAHLEALQGDPRLSVPETGRGRTVVLDYSSPNVAKPMHIGHVRSTVIGNAIDRLHRFLGFRVVADNHIGDWGTQFGKLIMGYRHFVDAEALEQEPVEELERVYVLSNDRAREDEDWLRQCREELVKLQRGDPENRRLWQEFVERSMQEFNRIYERLGVHFDLVRGESHYNDELQPFVDRLRAKGLAQESEGACVVFLEEEKLPVCLIQKSDGGFNYATTDLVTIEDRINEFEPEAIVYVTDQRQQLHFNQVFAVARRLGHRARLVHMWFGLMRSDEGIFAAREGNVIRLEKLLDEAERRALAVVEQTSPDMPAEARAEVARAVGLGAVKYMDLSQNPQSVVTFSWEKALALDGNSAPYLLYAYARISSVRDKYRERFPGRDPEADPIVLGEPLERRLAIRLARFPDVVRRAAELYRPNMLADYLYELAQVYSTFYQTVPFLKADRGVRESRVRLCDVVAKTLKQGLDLLGIETPARI